MTLDVESSPRRVISIDDYDTESVTISGSSADTCTLIVSIIDNETEETITYATADITVTEKPQPSVDITVANQTFNINAGAPATQNITFSSVSHNVDDTSALNYNVGILDTVALYNYPGVGLADGTHTISISATDLGPGIQEGDVYTIDIAVELDSSLIGGNQATLTIIDETPETRSTKKTTKKSTK